MLLYQCAAASQQLLLGNDDDIDADPQCCSHVGGHKLGDASQWSWRCDVQVSSNGPADLAYQLPGLLRIVRIRLRARREASAPRWCECAEWVGIATETLGNYFLAVDRKVQCLAHPLVVGRRIRRVAVDDAQQHTVGVASHQVGIFRSKYTLGVGGGYPGHPANLTTSQDFTI